jgi:hypothetical protein
MTAFAAAWREEQLPLWLRPVRVLVTSNESGMIEVVGSAISVHQTKKATGMLIFFFSRVASYPIERAGSTLRAYFKQEFGSAQSERFLEAQVSGSFSLSWCAACQLIPWLCRKTLCTA